MKTLKIYDLQDLVGKTIKWEGYSYDGLKQYHGKDKILQISENPQRPIFKIEQKGNKPYPDKCLHNASVNTAEFNDGTIGIASDISYIEYEIIT